MTRRWSASRATTVSGAPAFAKERKLRYPLLSDFEPKGTISRLHRAYREGGGVSECALFVLDADGADGILRGLDELSPP